MTQISNKTPFSKRVPIHAELIGSDKCTAFGFTVRANAPALAMCRQLLAAGLDPDTALQVYRGTTLALRVRTIGEGAQLTVRESTSDGRPRFARLNGEAPSLVRANYREAAE